jgi:hypothetical protein
VPGGAVGQPSGLPVTQQVGRAQRPITSADVAQLAGVSRATVSYVLNAVAHRTISQATVERVRNAAHTMGNLPHSMARSLRAGRSDLVPTLVNDHSRIGEHAADYRMQRGHRRIAAVVPSVPDLLPVGVERYSGVERVAKQCTLVRPRLTSVHLEGSHSWRMFAETQHRMIRREELELVAVHLLQSRVVPRESA